MTTAFVLGGGGLLGAHEVGMLRALSDAGVKPDLVVGTSIGALRSAWRGWPGRSSCSAGTPGPETRSCSSTSC
jgi:hypothetical protein